jgi:hypothetical protein
MRIFVCVTKPATQPAKRPPTHPTKQPTNQTNKQHYQVESFLGRDRHSTYDGIPTSEGTDGLLLFSNQVEIGPYPEALFSIGLLS